MVVAEGCDLTIPVPKLNVMPIDQALGALDGVVFVFERQFDAIDDVSIVVDDAGVVTVHRPAYSQPNNRRRQKRGARSAKKYRCDARYPVSIPR